jgi:uncharacterized protein (DUF1330 family)
MIKTEIQYEAIMKRIDELLKVVNDDTPKEDKDFIELMLTPVVELFGGKYIPRENFISRLEGVNWSLKRDEIFSYKKVLDVD